MDFLENDIKLPSLRDDLSWYRAALSFEVGDVPIETLCLPAATNTILRREGYSRVRDLLGVKLSSIDGIGRNRCELIRRALQRFFASDL